MIASCLLHFSYFSINSIWSPITVEELQKMAGLFDMTTDQIINFGRKIPKEVVLEDKTAVEQMKLIQQLDDEDKHISSCLTTAS